MWGSQFPLVLCERPRRSLRLGAGSAYLLVQADLRDAAQQPLGERASKG